MDAMEALLGRRRDRAGRRHERARRVALAVAATLALYLCFGLILLSRPAPPPTPVSPAVPALEPLPVSAGLPLQMPTAAAAPTSPG